MSKYKIILETNTKELARKLRDDIVVKILYTENICKKCHDEYIKENE